MRVALLVAVAVSSVALTAADVRAAERPAVVVTSGKEQQFSVALQKFGGNFDAEAYREGMAAALEFSSLFRLIDRKAFLGPTTTEVLSDRADVNCTEWSTIGADVFVEGVQSVDVEKGQFIAEFSVWDLAGCQRKLNRRYRQATSADPLILAKRMADDIVEVLTGARGVASTELTFVSKRSGNPEIFVMDADGGNQRAATANRSINNFPSWSPSGDSILYTSYRTENRPLLFISTRGQGKPGRILAPLSSKPLYRAVFHPSGRELAVVMSPSDSTEIYRVDLAGKNPRNLTRSRAIDVSPSWSPDGRWIAYQGRVGGQFDIWLIDPEGNVNLPLISHPRSDESPCWSPDARKIAFSSTRRGSADIYVIDSSGDHLRRLTSSRGDDTSPAWGPYPR